MLLPPAYRSRARNFLLLAVALFVAGCSRNAPQPKDADDGPGARGVGTNDPDEKNPPRDAEKALQYALLVGVKDYDHAALPPLKFTENDAEECGELLQTNGDQTTILTSTRGARDAEASPTARNFRRRLGQILKRANRDDLVLVGLAGHGLQMRVSEPDTKQEKEESFFCTSDAKPCDTKDLAELAETMVPLSELFKQLEDSGAGVKLLLVDACRNEPRLGRSIDLERIPAPPAGTAALFSCKSGERAFESGKLGGGHGVFFHFVIEALRGGAKNVRGEVSWNLLVDYVTEKVSDEVPRIVGGGARQSPHLITNLTGKSPVVLGGGGESPRAKVSAGVQAQARGLYEEGVALQKAHEYAQAIEPLTLALKVDPSMVGALLARSSCYDHTRKCGLAIKDCDEAIRLLPAGDKEQLAQAYALRGNARRRIKDNDRAIDDYTRSLELQPGAAKVYYFRGVAYAQKGDSRRAEADRKKGLQLGYKPPGKQPRK